MAYDLLTTSGIDSLVNNFKTNEANKRLSSLNNRKSKYQQIDSTYSTLSDKLNSLKTLMSSLKATGSSSAFIDKASSSSNTNFVTVASTGAALQSSSSIRVNQLAKNDLVLSQDLNSDDASTFITSPGTHNFIITTGDGVGGTYTSHISVTFETSDFTNNSISNKKVMEKIQTAINNNDAVITSNSMSGSTSSSGSFILDLNGTGTTINYSSGTYSYVIDNIVTQINSLSGVSAQKILDGSNYKLGITVTDSSKYISINGDTSNLVSELGIATTKEMGSSGLVSASVFSPVSSTSQLSLSAKKSGYNYRLLSLSDINLGNALNSFGLNLGSTRQTFVQNSGTDTPGYVCNTSALNSKIEFNGINVERDSNTISDLLTGVTLNLKSVMASTDSTVNLSVSNDTSKVKDKIQTFITKFNDIYTYLKKQTVSKDNTRGLLIGDSTASTVLSMLSSIATNSVTGIASDKLNSLSKIGITFDTSSGLSINDSTQLEDAINKNVDQVEAIFNSTNGIANNLFDRATLYLGAGGYISKSRTNFGNTINSLSDSITAEQTRIGKRAEALRASYIKLQQQLVTLMNNQSYFSSNGY